MNAVGEVVEHVSRTSNLSQMSPAHLRSRDRADRIFVRTSGSVTVLRRHNWILVAVAKLGFNYDKVRVHGKDSRKKIECLSY